MTLARWLILALWLVFIAYWAVSAFRAKRSVGGWSWRREVGLRLLILVAVGLALRSPDARRALREIAGRRPGPVLGALGVALSATGVGLAVWARAHLGRNWGLPMTWKAEPELVTSGPYARVRHPIYGGILLALIGSAVGASPLWAIPLAIAAPYFLYSARREERLMGKQFPAQYPAYRRRTRMLLPFLF